MRRALAGLLGLAAAALLACASYSIEAGDQAAAAGDWDTAFENYRDVAAREPGNAAAQSKLERARGEAAALHLARARAGIDAGNLEPALGELRRSLDYRPDAQVQALLERTQASFNKQEAARLLAKGASDAASGNLDSAQASFERALTLDGSLDPARKQLAKVSQDRVRAAELGKQAQGSLDAGRLDEAHGLAERARAVNREDGAAGAVVAALDKEQSALSAEREARSLESSGSVGPALDRARAAEQARSTDARVDLVERLERKAYDFHRDAAELALRRGAYESALDSYRRAYELRPDHDVALRIEELEQRIGPKLSGKEVLRGRVDSIVLVSSPTGSALGVYIGNGLVITNAAVLKAGTGNLMTASRSVVPFQRVWRHREADIGVLLAPDLNLPAAPLADTAQELPEGTHVNLITNGDQGGVILGQGSVIGESPSFDQRTRVVPFDSSVALGAERGPIFDERGRLLGIVAATSARDRRVHYAVPVDYALALLRDIRRR